MQTIQNPIIEPNSQNIILVGMMGSGKSTIGKALAKHLKMRFIDSDYEIQRRTGVSITHIFDVEGEHGFRVREACEIEEILKQNSIVLATGGGAVLNEKNRENMKRRGIIVYLQANIHELWQRTKHDKGRPLLQTQDPLRKLSELYDQRNPIYIEVADIVIQTGRQSVQTLMLELEGEIEKFRAR